MRIAIKYIKRNYCFLIFLLIFLIGVFFRFYKLNSIPFGLNNDAAWEGSAAIEILKGNIFPYFPYAAEGWRGEGIIRIIVAFFTLIFGNDPLTIKLASNIFGIGFIATSFFLVKELFDKKVALLTSFFIAISGWHITMSKTGWRAVTVPFFTTLVFYCFFRGVKRKEKVFFLLSGAFLSIVTFYTYDAARVVPVFFLFWLFIEALTRKKFLIDYLSHLGILFLSFFLVSIPMLQYAILNWQNFTSRSEFLFIGHQIKEAGNLYPLFNNLVTSALLFNVRANGNDFFIFDPLIDKPVAILLPIGLVITLIFIFLKKNKNFFFMMMYLIFSLIPGILSVPNGNRGIGAILPAYFLASVGLIFPLIWLTKKLRIKNFLIYLLVFIFCFYSSFITYKLYLSVDRKELAGLYPETLIATNFIKTVWDDYDIYLTDNYPRELLTYYLYRPEQSNAFDKNYTWLDSSYQFLSVTNSKDKKGLMFFMFANSENELVVDLLSQRFPNGKKFYLWYNNDNIQRPASLVFKVPKT